MNYDDQMIYGLYIRPDDLLQNPLGQIRINVLVINLLDLPKQYNNKQFFKDFTTVKKYNNTNIFFPKV